MLRTTCSDYHPSFGSFAFSPRTLPMAQVKLIYDDDINAYGMCTFEEKNSIQAFHQSTAAVFLIFSELGIILKQY